MSSPFPPPSSVPVPVRYGSGGRPSHPGGWVAVGVFALAMLVLVLCVMGIGGIVLAEATFTSLPLAQIAGADLEPAEKQRLTEEAGRFTEEMTSLMQTSIVWTALLSACALALVVTSIGVLRRSERMRAAAGIALVVLTIAFAGNQIHGISLGAETDRALARFAEAMKDVDTTFTDNGAFTATPATAICVMLVWLAFAIPAWIGLRTAACREWCGASARTKSPRAPFAS